MPAASVPQGTHRHADLDEVLDRIDQPFLDSIAMMTNTFEVGARTAADWETGNP